MVLAARVPNGSMVMVTGVLTPEHFVAGCTTDPPVGEQPMTAIVVIVVAEPTVVVTAMGRHCVVVVGVIVVGVTVVAVVIVVRMIASEHAMGRHCTTDHALAHRLSIAMGEAPVVAFGEPAVVVTAMGRHGVSVVAVCEDLVVVVACTGDDCCGSSRSGPQRSRPGRGQPGSDGQDTDARDEGQDGIDAVEGEGLVHLVKGEPEQQHAEGVHGRDDDPEQDGVDRSPASPDQVGGHHRLAVPGGKGVTDADEHSDAEHAGEHERRHLLAVEQAG